MPTTTGKATEFIQFTRASNATVTDSDGKIKWAPHNLLTNSESFDAAAWTKYLAPITANAQVAPNGTTTADTVTTSDNYSSVNQTLAVLTGATYTLAFYAKRGTMTDAKLSVRDVNNAADIVAATSYYSTINSSTWSLVTQSFTVPAGCTTITVHVLKESFATGTIHLWGAHLYRSDLGGMQANTSAYPMYNPTTAKNLLGSTEDFSAAAWVVEGSSAATNVANAINGLMTADRVTETAVTSAHAISQTLTLVAGRYTYSVYLKKGTGATAPDWVQLTFGGNASDWANFNLTGSGSVGNSSSVGIAAITAVSDGWYRCSLAMSPAAGASSVQIAFTNNTNSASRRPSYAGATTSDVLVWGAQLSDSASLDPYVPNHFTAPSAAAYYGPRRDFDGATLACKGLLVEEQRANLVLNSHDLGAASWVPGNATVATNVSISPDGTSSADKLTGDGANTGHYIRSSITLAINTTYTLSAFVKTAELQWFYLSVGGTGASSGGAPVSTFNSTTVALGSISANIVSRSIVNVGNGWSRAQITFTSAGTVGGNFIEMSVATSDTTGVNTASGGILYYGAQLEAGSFATSYIPTGAATATRSADVASVSTQAFPYSATEGTLVTNFQLLGGNTGVSLNVVALEGAVGNATLHREGGTWRYRTELANLNVTNVLDAPVNKIGFAYALSDYPLTPNGGAIQTNTGSGLIGSATTLRIGYGTIFASAKQLNGHIRQITYLPRRISNTELQTRTA